MYIHTILFKYSAHSLYICNGATLRTRERVLRIALFTTVYMHSVDVYMHFNGGLQDLHICSTPHCIQMLNNRCIYSKRASNIQKGRQEGHYIQKWLPEGHCIHRSGPHIQNPLFFSVYICGTIRIDSPRYRTLGRWGWQGVLGVTTNPRHTDGANSLAT